MNSRYRSRYTRRLMRRLWREERNLSSLSSFALLLLAIIASVGVGIAISNIVSRAWHEQDMDYDMTACEQVGLENCHIEDIHDGLIWVDYDIIGWPKK